MPLPGIQEQGPTVRREQLFQLRQRNRHCSGATCRFGCPSSVTQKCPRPAARIPHAQYFFCVRRGLLAEHAEFVDGTPAGRTERTDALVLRPRALFGRSNGTGNFPPAVCVKQVRRLWGDGWVSRHSASSSDTLFFGGCLRVRSVALHSQCQATGHPTNCYRKYYSVWRIAASLRSRPRSFPH